MADKKSTKGAKTKGKVPFFWTKKDPTEKGTGEQHAKGGRVGLLQGGKPKLATKGWK